MTAPSLALVDHPSDREIRFTRTVDAPIDLGWSIWSDPVHLHRWFGPTGFQHTTESFDFRVGGEWRFTMHAPDGRHIPNRIRFTEILPPTRLVYENGWDSPGKALDFLVTWSFRAEGAKRTRIEIVMRYADAAALKVAVEHYGVNPGGPQTLERIARQLEALQQPPVDTSGREIVTVRVVKASRDKVWEAWTVPEQWKKWWGPDGFTTTLHTMEVRTGGAWSFIMHGPDGTDYRNESVYTEIIRPRLIQYRHLSTPRFLATATFDALGAETRVTLRVILDTEADYRRAVEVFHAIEGGRQTLAKLAALLEG